MASNLDGVSQEIVVEKTEIVADKIVNDNVIANLIYKGFTRECCSNCHTLPSASLTPQGIRSGNVNLDGVSQEIVAEKTEMVADKGVNKNVITNLIYNALSQ